MVVAIQVGEHSFRGSLLWELLEAFAFQDMLQSMAFLVIGLERPLIDSVAFQPARAYLLLDAQRRRDSLRMLK